MQRVMFKRLEEIIEDHRRRNRQTVIVALAVFFLVFLLFNFVFAFWILQGGPRAKVAAILSWQPSGRQYIFSLIEVLLLLWWGWLFLNYKLLQMRLSLVSEHMIEDYKGRQMGIKEPTPWGRNENPSFFTKQVGSKILLAMTGLLILSILLRLGSYSITLILSIGLVAYEVTAIIQSKKIETFIRSIPQTYTSENASFPAQNQKYLISGLVCGIVLTIAADQLMHFSKYDLIFFFLALSGLCVASVLFAGITRHFMEAVRVADTARLTK